ncbi:hypothetical protein MBLNU230_g3120t1 [Neophaeotheca triangularis]
MPDERELSNALGQLRTFEDVSKQQQTSLSDILQNYHTLIEDFRRLKSDYEEERDAREKYKQMARGSERASFVLVLIDGDGYVFDDGLISKGTEGGQAAGQLLSRTVRNSLANRGLDSTCSIMVRVYTNLAGLSKAASKAGLCGPEKRSLAPFAASFTRSNDLFDFVDAGDLKENADFKIRAMFRQFVNNPSCKHIFFAGCHDVGYVAELTPYRDNHEKITLVRTPAFHHQFNNLGLRIEEFHGVFRTAPLDTQQKFFAPKQPMVAQQAPPVKNEPQENNKPICNFFQKGQCKYGNGCKFAHIKVRSNHTSIDHTQPSSAADWRANADPFQTPYTSQEASAFFRNQQSNFGPQEEQTQNQIDFTAELPQRSQIPRGQIPVNKAGYRLDPFVRNPTAAEKNSFFNRVQRKKFCNTYHILGTCRNGSCEFDHDPMAEGEFNRLLQIVQGNPCKARGDCRNLNCYSGHVCQNAVCRYRGGKMNCKFGPRAHEQEMQVDEYVPGVLMPGDGAPGERVNDPTSPFVADIDNMNGYGKDGESASDMDDEVDNYGATLPTSPGPQSPFGEQKTGAGGTSTLGLQKSSWVSGWAGFLGPGSGQ